MRISGEVSLVIDSLMTCGAIYVSTKFTKGNCNGQCNYLVPPSQQEIADDSLYMQSHTSMTVCLCLSPSFSLSNIKLTSASSSSGQSSRATGSTGATGDPPVMGLLTVPVTYLTRSYTQSVPLSSPHTRMHDTEFWGRKKATVFICLIVWLHCNANKM